MSMQRAKAPDAPELEVAWAAGFLDGEGTFDLARKAGGMQPSGCALGR